MKTNSSYLPLFFLCGAFLYTPLAVLSVFPSQGKGRDAVTDPLPRPGICAQVDLVEVNGCGVRPFFCFDAASFLPEQEQFGDGDIGLTDKRFFAYGLK
ncbi:hypothetical protein QFZ20_000504 [Flavobacterium sp. W4I14]|nr:hypothetical protein [Flavobacterium sp. W4I14]